MSNANVTNGANGAQYTQGQDYVLTYNHDEQTKTDIMQIATIVPGYGDGFKPLIYVEDFKLHIDRSFKRFIDAGVYEPDDPIVTLANSFQNEIIINIPRDFINCSYSYRFYNGIAYITITNKLNTPDIKRSIY